MEGIKKNWGSLLDRPEVSWRAELQGEEVPPASGRKPGAKPREQIPPLPKKVHQNSR
jgi:hypothetical protein